MTDATLLPDPPLSHHAPGWWGSRLMIIVEGIALATLAFIYFYIRNNFASWPPAPTHPPDLRVPSLNLLVICAGAVPFWNAARLARGQARPQVVAAWLAAGVLLGISAIVLRGFDFAALHVRFYANEYGAITWAILIVHLGHLLAGTIESALAAIVLFVGPVERKRYTDVTAMAVYWYAIAISWIVLYTIVFISPRFKFV